MKKKQGRGDGSKEKTKRADRQGQTVSGNIVPCKLWVNLLNYPCYSEIEVRGGKPLLEV